MSSLAAMFERGVAEIERTARAILEQVGLGHVDWQATARSAYEFVADPWVRSAALIVIVYMTIRVIASVYSGDQQNSEMGPVGIRPHAAQRLDRQTVVLPRQLMAMNMDGVTADMKVFMLTSMRAGNVANNSCTLIVTFGLAFRL